MKKKYNIHMLSDFRFDSFQDLFYIMTTCGLGLTAIYWSFKILLSIIVMFFLKRLDQISYRLYGRENYLENRIPNSRKNKRGFSNYMSDYFKDDNIAHVSSVIALWSDSIEFFKDYISLLVVLKRINASPSSLKKIGNKIVKIKNNKPLYPYEWSEINNKEWKIDSIKWKNKEINFSNLNGEISTLKITTDDFFKTSKKGRLKKIIPVGSKQYESWIVIGNGNKKTLLDVLKQTTTFLK